MAGQATKRYNGTVLVLSVAYALLLMGSTYLFKHGLISGGAAWIAAILPALPIVGIFAAIGRYLVEERDEYVRMLMVRQTLWASGFALTIATVWGFLESFGLVHHVEAYAVAILWFGGLALGAIANKFSVGSGA